MSVGGGIVSARAVPLGVPCCSPLVVLHLWAPCSSALLRHFPSVMGGNKRWVNVGVVLFLLVLYSSAFLATRHSWGFTSGRPARLYCFHDFYRFWGGANVGWAWVVLFLLVLCSWACLSPRHFGCSACGNLSPRIVFASPIGGCWDQAAGNVAGGIAYAASS